MFRFAQHDRSSMKGENLRTEFEIVLFIGVIRVIRG